MKLRNKKTGEIVEAESCNSTTGMIGLYYVDKDDKVGTKDCFETLAELNEEWEDYKERNDGLSSEDWTRICDCIRRRIAEKCKAISQRVDDYSSQYCWGIAETVIDDFKLLSKVEELCGKETEDE